MPDYYQKPLGEWTDAELSEELTRRYEPSRIPSCVVCGGKLSIQAAGGGKPTVWACSMQEEDPSQPGRLRAKEGRGGREEFGPDGHYSRSHYEDRRRGGDDAVMEVLRRWRAVG